MPSEGRGRAQDTDCMQFACAPCHSGFEPVVVSEDQLKQNLSSSCAVGLVGYFPINQLVDHGANSDRTLVCQARCMAAVEVQVLINAYKSELSRGAKPEVIIFCAEQRFIITSKFGRDFAAIKKCRADRVPK